MRTAVEVGLPVEQTREKLKWRPIMDIRNERRADRANTLKILGTANHYRRNWVEPGRGQRGSHKSWNNSESMRSTAEENKASDWRISHNRSLNTCHFLVPEPSSNRV